MQPERHAPTALEAAHALASRGSGPKLLPLVRFELADTNVPLVDALRTQLLERTPDVVENLERFRFSPSLHARLTVRTAEPNLQTRIGSDDGYR
jgi:hypothetical protein